MNALPPRSGKPSFLTVLDLGRDPLRRPLHYFERLGDTFGGRFLGKDFVITRDAAVFEDVLVKKHRSFIKDELTRGLGKLLGKGLLTSDGDAWKHNRRLIQAQLQAPQIERYLPIFREEAERSLAAWVPGKTFDLHSQMAALAMRITLRGVFGTDGRDLEEFEASMRDVMHFFTGIAGTSTPLPTVLPTPTNRRFLRARAHLTGALGQILEQAKANSEGTSILQSLLAARDAGQLSEQQLIDEGLTFLLAGHETTALALTYTLALLADAPVEQAAIRAEVGTLPPPDGLPALRSQRALTRALKESMRLYPESWAIGREALEDLEIGPWRVKRGTQVYLYQWAAHQHPRWFEHPNEFRPERWTAEFEAALPRLAYTPFGAGPRICIGNHFAWAELITVLATFLGRVEFKALHPFRPRLLASITARPRDPVPIQIAQA